MTTLAIMATYEKKRLKCYGTVAAGEHVAVTVTDGAQWIGEGKALRLRVLFGPDTVGVFPFADGDAWTATGTQNADAYCELNLNTLQAEKYLKRGGPCLWILDDVENHTLYATGEFEVLPWPKRRGIDEPIDLDGYPLLLDEIKDLEEAFEEYQRTVAQMLATKQNTIFDLATIRSGAAAGATAVQPSQIARFVDDAEYKAQYGEQNKPAILFRHGTNVIVALDATPFVRDGMVADVKIVGGNLVITFNTDSGKQPITVPLTDIFDPANYYDKTAADGKFVAKEAGKGLSTEDYTTTAKTKLGGIAAGAQVNVIETVKVNGTALTPQDKAVNIPVPTLDNTVTPTSANGVKSSGIWSAIWGALAALPTGFTSLYDWCASQLAGKLSTSGGAMTGVIYGIRTSSDTDRTINLSKIGLAPNGINRKGAGNLGICVSLQDGKEASLYIDNDGKVYINTPNGYVEVPNATSGGTLALAAGTGHTGSLAALDANGNPADSLILAANVAVKGDLPYAISESIPLTVTSGAASTTLADRTHNVRTVAAPGSGNTTTITATLPPIVAGKSRDMFLNLTVGTQASDAGDISLSIVEPSGATVQIDIGSVEDIGIGKNEIFISENALPTTSGNVTTTHWLVTVRHEDFT